MSRQSYNWPKEKIDRRSYVGHCAMCGKETFWKRADGMFCSDHCRVKFHRFSKTASGILDYVMSRVDFAIHWYEHYGLDEHILVLVRDLNVKAREAEIVRQKLIARR